MKLKRSITINPNYIEAVSKVSHLSLPMKQAVSLVKIIRVLQEETEVTKHVSMDLMKEFGIKAITNQGLEFEDESLFDSEKFNRKWDDLMEQEFDIPLEEKISLPESAVISASDLLTLSELIDY